MKAIDKKFYIKYNIVISYNENSAMKKLFKTFLILIVVALCGSIVIVEAKGITIIRDDNPDGVSVLSIDNENYYIEIDEETNVGYVMQKLDNETIVLGTCKVSVIVGDKDPEVLCVSTENSMGSLVIVTNSSVSTISLSEGDISSIFTIDTKVIINR